MQTITGTTKVASEVTVSQAVRTLGAVLKATPELRAFLKATQAVYADLTVQHLLREVRSHRSALQWGQSHLSDHYRALSELQSDLDSQPAVQAYSRAEQTARQLLRVVDVAIGEAAGVDFAANAKRSCCGG